MESIPSPSARPAAIPAAHPPWWISVLDVLGLVLLLLTFRAIVGHGARYALTSEFYLSFTSWPRTLLWTVALLAFRHLLWRQVPWHVRVTGWGRTLLKAESFRAAWPPFVVSRLMVTAVAYFAVATVGFEPPRPWRALDNDVLDLFARWDAGWYHTIASIGYQPAPQFDPDEQSALAFFPGLPMLIRTTGLWLSLNRWHAGILVVVIAFLWGLTYVYRLAREDLPADQARASLLFLTFYPFAVCYSAILTESVFLLAAAGAFFHFRRGQLGRAGAFALFAGLLRPNGFLLSVPLALTALIPFARTRGWLPGRRASEARWIPLAARLAIATLPIVGMLMYATYVRSVTGDPFAWVKAQQAWGRSAAGVADIIDARRELIEMKGWSEYGRQYPAEIIEGAAALFALAAVVPISIRFGLPYGLFVAMSVLPPLISMGSVSLGRYTAPLFPIFLWLGASVPPHRRHYWIGVFAAGQALIAVMFFTWRAPY